MAKKTQWILDNWVSPILLLLIVVFGLALCSGCNKALAGEAVKAPAKEQVQPVDKVDAKLKELLPKLIDAEKKLHATTAFKDYENQRKQLFNDIVSKSLEYKKYEAKRVKLHKKLVQKTPEWKPYQQLVNTYQFVFSLKNN